MYTENDYFYYLVKLHRCTKIETLIIRLSVPLQSGGFVVHCSIKQRAALLCASTLKYYNLGEKWFSKRIKAFLVE